MNNHQEHPEQIVKDAQIARNAGNEELVDAIRELRSIAECSSFLSEEVRGQMKLVAAAAERGLPTVETNVWHVEFCADGIPHVSPFFGACDEVALSKAHEFMWGLERGEEPDTVGGYIYTCIKLTGPHKQAVPLTSCLLDE